jgi:hypothetical protein
LVSNPQEQQEEEKSLARRPGGAAQRGRGRRCVAAEKANSMRRPSCALAAKPKKRKRAKRWSSDITSEVLPKGAGGEIGIDGADNSFDRGGGPDVSAFVEGDAARWDERWGQFGNEIADIRGLAPGAASVDVLGDLGIEAAADGGGVGLGEGHPGNWLETAS